jgi:outer membrane immunogenic protein
MIKTALAALALSASVLLSTSAAQAADPYVDPAYDWTGFYLGVQTGYVWGNSTSTDFLNNGAGPLHAKGDIDPDGFFGGLHSGYNYQSGSLVYGVEGDINLGSVDGSDSALTFAGGVRPPTWKHEGDMDAFGSFRFRFGVAADRFLPFVTVGIAGADYDVKLTHVNDISNHNEFLVGWTAGAGVQYAFTDTFSARLEYRYADYGSFTDRFDNFPAEVVRADLQTHSIMAGLTFKF